MKFKYNLGERILFRRVTATGVTEEAIGTITAIKQTLQQDGVKLLWDVFSSDTNWPVTDSDILGTVTVKRAPAPRVRKKKAVVQTQTEMLNGKVGYMGDVNGLGCDPGTV